MSIIVLFRFGSGKGASMSIAARDPDPVVTIFRRLP
jgi:hypothetical protein